MNENILFIEDMKDGIVNGIHSVIEKVLYRRLVKVIGRRSHSKVITGNSGEAC